MKTLAVLLLVILLTGCGTFSRWKDHRKNKSETTSSTTSTTTVVEKVDTIVRLKKDSVVAIRHIDELLKGKPIEAREGSSSVRVTYDGRTGNVRAVGVSEAREVPVTLDRVTKSENKTDQVATTKEVVLQDNIQKKSGGFAWGIIITLLVFIVLFVLFLFRRPRDGLRTL